MKRKAPLGAGYDYEAFREGIRFLDGLDCWVRRLLEERQLEHPLDWSVSALTCAGELDGHHLLRKNRLKQELRSALFPLGPWETLADVLADPRWGVLGCRRHHDMIECGQIVIQRDELPQRFFEAVEDARLEGWSDRYYPPVGRAG